MVVVREELLQQFLLGPQVHPEEARRKLLLHVAPEWQPLVTSPIWMAGCVLSGNTTKSPFSISRAKGHTWLTQFMIAFGLASG
jgi:hypothetical protein